MSEFSISGECSAHHLDIVNFSFKQTFPTRFPPVYFTGSWVSSTESLSGTWGEASDPRTHSGVFIFKRTPPECMCFFPPPTVLKQNNSKALWQFSIAAVRYGVRKNTWSWSFFEQRAKSRKRFVELYIRSTRFGRPLTRNEEEELGLLKKSFTTAGQFLSRPCRISAQWFHNADSRFYHSIAEHQIRETTDHE
jgi:hypothetical protein